jgi:hypothetical protein
VHIAADHHEHRRSRQLTREIGEHTDELGGDEHDLGTHPTQDVGRLGW